MNALFMSRSALTAAVLTLALTAAQAGAAGPARELTAEQVVAKNVAARGGAEAWQKIQTMAWVGHVETASVPGHNMPFLLEQKRPHSTRFELIAQNQKSIRAYDGSKGWKLRPGSNGMPELQPYTPEELNFARGAQAVDGPLMEDVAQGAVVTFGGVDAVDGHSAYLLNVQLPNGAHHRVWVDAQSFLELKYEREFPNAQGRNAVTAVLYRDYHDFEGLKLPTVIEFGAAGAGDASRMVIERIALNPPLDEKTFAQPNVPQTRRHGGVIVDTRAAPH
jgi:hypothetical protein